MCVSVGGCGQNIHNSVGEWFDCMDGGACQCCFCVLVCVSVFMVCVCVYGLIAWIKGCVSMCATQHLSLWRECV